MNCRQAKADIALWIGEDLPDRDRREELRRHVSACAGCRKHYKRLKGTLQVLEHADRERTYDVSDSVWPELARRIEQHSESRSRGARFNGWLPFVAVTVACVALVVVMETQHRPAPDLSSDPMPSGVFTWPSLFQDSTESESPAMPSVGSDRIDHLSGVTLPEQQTSENSHVRRVSTDDSF